MPKRNIWHRWWKTGGTWRNEGKEEMVEWGQERGMEWDRKWKAFSGFTPCDLISVIMGFMSVPSRRPHTTSHVPGLSHLHTHTHTWGHVFHSLAQGQTRSMCFCLSVCSFSHTLFVNLHILHHTPGHMTRPVLTLSVTHAPDKKKEYLYFAGIAKGWNEISHSEFHSEALQIFLWNRLCDCGVSWISKRFSQWGKCIFH